MISVSLFLQYEISLLPIWGSPLDRPKLGGFSSSVSPSASVRRSAALSPARPRLSSSLLSPLPRHLAHSFSRTRARRSSSIAAAESSRLLSRAAMVRIHGLPRSAASDLFVEFLLKPSRSLLVVAVFKSPVACAVEAVPAARSNCRRVQASVLLKLSSILYIIMVKHFIYLQPMLVMVLVEVHDYVHTHTNSWYCLPIMLRYSNV